MVKPQPVTRLVGHDHSAWHQHEVTGEWWRLGRSRSGYHDIRLAGPYRCPYGAVGDTLWVREAFRAIEDPGARRSEVRRMYEEDGETHYIVVDYRSDAPATRIMDKLGRPGWRSPIHMPRWASRLTLEVTGVCVERVQEITEAEAIAEGHEATANFTAREHFARLWGELHGAGAWERNPFVWVVGFRMVE